MIGKANNRHCETCFNKVNVSPIRISSLSIGDM